jgi:hypothetical protein
VALKKVLLAKEAGNTFIAVQISKCSKKGFGKFNASQSLPELLCSLKIGSF